MSKKPTCYAITHKRNKPCAGKHICPLEEVNKTKKPVTVEHIHYDIDGNVRYVDVHGFPIFDGEGNVVQMIEYTLDITSRKRAEETLKESEERYRQLYDEAPVGYHEIDRDGKIVQVNQTEAALLGYRIRDMIGRSVWDFMAPTQRKLAKAAIREKIQKQRTLEGFERRYMSKDGSEIDVYIEERLIIDCEGKVSGIRSILQDITERKQAEEELQVERSKLQATMAAVEGGITIQDHEYNIIYQNKFLEDRFGGIGGKCYRVYEGRKEICEGCPVEKAFKDGKSHMAERKVVMPNSDIAYWNNTASPIRDTTGKIVGCVELAIDITEWKKAEEQIRASLREKEILLREINHRVKNNLQIISSLLNLQSKKIEDEQALKMFQESQNRVRSMALIHEKLYQSKDFTDISFGDYIRSLATELFQFYELDPSRIKLTLEVENISVNINAAIPYGLIINELITNALKHAFPSSIVSAGNGRYGEGGQEIRITFKQTDRNVELVVSDNGVGIPSDIDFLHTKSMGLNLVKILAENQLRGNIELDRSHGTQIQIVVDREA